jgi:hypothetical protein
MLRCYGTTHQPFFVHRHLLNGRALRHGKIFHTALADGATFKQDSDWKKIEILTIEVHLKSFRGLEMWSRWLYGQPMWDEDDCKDVDHDLCWLTDILHLCGGREDGKGRDYEGLNACMDAIRDLVLNETSVPENPIYELLGEDEDSDLMVKMLAELLVHGKCASDGRTKKWLEENGGEHQSFLDAISNEFAKKAMGEAAPDLMARGAYHITSVESDCDPSPRERASTGKVTRRNLLMNAVLTLQILLQNSRAQHHSVMQQPD